MSSANELSKILRLPITVNKDMNIHQMSQLLFTKIESEPETCRHSLLSMIMSIYGCLAEEGEETSRRINGGTLKSTSSTPRSSTITSVSATL